MAEQIEINFLANTQQALARIQSFTRGIQTSLNAIIASKVFGELKKYGEQIVEVTKKYDDLFEAQKKMGVQMGELEKGAITQFQNKVADVREGFGQFKLRMEETALIVSDALMPAVSGALSLIHI